jgi:anti-repressor protein
MSEIEIFKNPEFGEIRTVVIDDEPWFVGKDVADALGYSNSRDAFVRHVDDEDKTSVVIPDVGSNYKSKSTLINESGLYSLVLSSKLPTAKKFKRWVTSEVLPAIRKTGGYIAGSENMTEAEIMARAVLIGQRTIEEQQKRIAELKPKADYTEKILASTDLVTTTAIAKDYGMSAQRLNNLLKGLKILFKRSGQWFLYAKYQNDGYTSSDTISFTHKNGDLGSVMHTKWTQKGRKFLYEKLKETGILPMIERQGN